MKTLILCVDRDDDFGTKAGLNSPFIGREENLNAAIALGLKDAEDSDINTLLASINLYDEMARKGMTVEIATICGDIDVGYQSDLVLATQLETVLEVVKPDRVVLVSDGAEDEYIYPVISSRVKVDSVRKVYVKQAATVESAYYILIKMLHDDKIRKRILVPIGLALFVFGVFALLDHLMDLYNKSTTVSFTNMGLAMIWAVVGLYLLAFAYKVGDRLRQWWLDTRRAVRSGSTLIPFAVLAILLFFLGLLYGLDAATANPENNLLLKSLLFVSGTMWMWVFAYFTYQIGMFINHFLSKGTLSYTYVVASVTVFAVGFILQGALDAAQTFLGYNSFDQAIIILEIVSGFLLAVFGGLLNTSLRNVDETSGKEGEKAETTETVE
jgi:putative membrane protein